jgi:queuine tRNA-ribosyltransferase
MNAIGGLSVGEPHEDMYNMTDLVTDILPKEKPRYLMGVGLPENILESIARGIDMFDCVLPSRNARHGIIYTSKGIMNMKNAKWKEDLSVIDENSPSPSSRVHTKAYLRHLFHVKELLGAQIGTLQNLSFFLWLVNTAREKILEGTFTEWKEKTLIDITRRL